MRIDSFTPNSPFPFDCLIAALDLK
jgi:hypothetical protein